MHYLYNGVRNSLFLALSLFTAVSVFAQTGPEERVASPTEPFAPNLQPSLEIPRTDEDIHIDGRLDETIWQNAAVATNFSENFPDELARPPSPTLLAPGCERLIRSIFLEIRRSDTSH